MISNVSFYEVKCTCEDCDKGARGENVSHNTWHFPHYNIYFTFGGGIPPEGRLIGDFTPEQIKGLFPASWSLTQCCIARCNEYEGR